jgi:hypothetical protein
MTNTPNATPDPVNSQAADPSVDRRFLLGGLAGVAGLTAFAAMARSASAGPLNPPAGSVAGTGRTLDEVYNKIPAPIGGGSGDGRIPIPGGTGTVELNTPGSYVLTGDIVVSGSTRGIRVLPNADGGLYAIDLNGYSIRSSSGASQGISVSQFYPNITVRISNGLIGGFTVGVSIQQIKFVELEGLVVAGNTTSGISSAALNSIIRRCQVSDTPTGIDLSGLAGEVNDCVIITASQSGLRVTSASNGLLLRRVTVIGAQQGLTLPAEPKIVYRDNTFINCAVPVSAASGGFGTATNGGGNFPA